MSKVKEWTDLFSSWETEEQAQVKGKQAQAERMLKARWYVYNRHNTFVEEAEYRNFESYARSRIQGASDDEVIHFLATSFKSRKEQERYCEYKKQVAT